MSFLKSNPTYLAFASKSALVRISYRPVFKQLRDFLSTLDYVCEEDLKSLFECLLLSYFNRAGEGPNAILYTLLTDNGFPLSHEESAHADIALSIVEQIDTITRTHFPGHFGLGNMLHREIPVEDVSLYQNDQLLIRLSPNTIEQLKQELRHDRSVAYCGALSR